MINPRICSPYRRASQDTLSIGLIQGLRPQPTLEEARSELAEAIAKVAGSFFYNSYGSLFSVVTEQTIENYLKEFEMKINRNRENITLVHEEILDRIFSRCQSSRK